MSEKTANDEAIEAWNTVLFDKFVRFRHVLTSGLGWHGDELINAYPPAPGARLLDVGCGFGDMTQQLAERVGPSGEAWGVDAAARFIEASEADARDKACKNARFFVADVQSEDLRGPYDAVYARFGTQFFSLPVAALRNMRGALKPGGKLAVVVWRKRQDNPWMYAAEVRVKELVQEPEETDQVTCGPGPFSMAGADTVSDMLIAAGFKHPTFQRYDTDICIGRDLEDAVEFAMALGPAGEVLRLAGKEAERLRPQVIAALREVLSGYVQPNGVMAPSSSWFVSAENP